MPLRMCLAHPIGFAALAIVAIGFISYQIFSKKQKTKVRTSRRSRGSSNYPQDYPDIYPSDHPNNYPGRPDSPDNYPGKPKFYSGQTIARKRNNNDGKCKNSYTESSKSANNEFITENKENSSVKTCDESFNDLNSLSQTKEENKIRDDDKNIDQQNKIRNDDKNIDQRYAISPDCDDGASVSSESNNSSISTETNFTNSERIGEQDQENGNISIESQKNHKEVTPLNEAEEIYKMEVYDHLKADSAFRDCSDKDEDNPFSDVDSVYSFSSNSVDGNGNSLICKGCEEILANAVNYPCGHCYLCLDCAIKVHRIYKKCNVCNLRIETFN